MSCCYTADTHVITKLLLKLYDSKVARQFVISYENFGKMVNLTFKVS